MEHVCKCGGKKIITGETSSAFVGPTQYDWRCEKCGKVGKGWSFDPKKKVYPIKEEVVWEEVNG